ncbi:DUF4870 family protein [Bowmanella dokdonensis]|uniref:Transmembrane protein n=1 Tax=Bowmanella dokdonensis TaxID=751969 RepID=A0A939IN58_9ALTE|nr:hypothetical protein [Bowmanella dokdonensis]MBN7826018.1 hypothetical protein [Bowmanella dokdonensis]
MTEQQPQTDSSPLSAYDEAAKTNALIAYCLMAAGLFTGIFWFIGVFWAMVKRAEARQSRFADHYENITTTFWWALGLGIVGLVLAIVLVGYAVLFAVWLWVIYRIVKGLARLTSNKPYNDAEVL